jgi:hypothetical protein
MKRTLLWAGLVLAAGILGVVLVASAEGAGERVTKAIRPHGGVAALALDGSLVAFAQGSPYSAKVVVWNLRTGKTTKVGGVSDANLAQLAIAGSRVAWYAHAFGNSEGDDYLYTSSLSSPKQRQVLSEVRSGAQCGAGESGPTPACAGTWLGGVVGAGNRILVNRWTTDTTGAISNAGLYALRGARLKSVATGPGTVEAVAADSQRVAVLHWRWFHPGKTIGVYSSTGRRLSNVTPKSQPLGVAISGRNLVILEKDGNLALYDARTGSLRRAFNLHAKQLPPRKRSGGNPRWLQALAVQGNIAVYSKPVRYVKGGTPRESVIYALNLSSGKNRAVGRSAGQIPLARIDSVGLVYATQAEGYAPNSLVFVPFKRVADAVR